MEHKTMPTTLATLPKPWPVTASVPTAGRWFFNASRERSYELAKRGLLITISTGTRGKAVLVHPTARKLGLDPTA
jgi:hypothetical protein